MNSQLLRVSLKALIPALTLSITTPAMAQFAKPEDAIKYRQSAFALMGAHMGRLSESSKVRFLTTKRMWRVTLPSLAPSQACLGKHLAPVPKVAKLNRPFGKKMPSSSQPLIGCKLRLLSSILQRNLVTLRI